METTNYYSDKNKRKLLINAKTNQKGNSDNQKEKIIDTAKDVGSDLLLGVLGGGLLAATLGRYAFVTGLCISGYGHYSKNQKLSALGLGLMASGTMSSINGKPIDQKLPATDQIGQRFTAFGEELKQKLFLDKLMPEKKDNLINGTEKGINAEPVLRSMTTKPVEKDFREEVDENSRNVGVNRRYDKETERMPNDETEDDDLLNSDRIY